MRYATSYDLGDRKRPDGVNEDSVTVCVFEEGHREGYRDQSRTVDLPTEEGVEIPATRSVAVFALADGAGGREAGDVASYIATTVVCEELAGIAIRAARSRPSAFDVTLSDGPTGPSEADLQAAIRSAIRTAHRAILTEPAASEARACTTIVAGVAVGGALHIGWVGDSRAYLVNRASEDVARLTKDHAVVERLREQGDIDDIEAQVHPRGNEITRALGSAWGEETGEETVGVDTRSVPLYAEDVVLVTSDGLVDAQTDTLDLYDEYVESDRAADVGSRVRERVVTDDEIRDIVLDAESLEGAAARFVRLANDRGGKDNVSTLLFQDTSLESTPGDAEPGDRDVDAQPPIEERKTVLVNGE